MLNPPAIHQQSLAGDEITLVRGKKDESPNNLIIKKKAAMGQENKSIFFGEEVDLVLRS